MEECLAYFRDAIERPEAVQRWLEWWVANADRFRQAFNDADYIRLKFRRLDAARAIMERLGRPVVEPPTVEWLHRTHCPHCGETLMKFVTGAERTREQVLAFGHRSGIEQCQKRVQVASWHVLPTGVRPDHDGIPSPRGATGRLTSRSTRPPIWGCF